MQYLPAAAGGISSFSVTSDDLSRPVIAYAQTSTGAVKFKKYDSGSWSSATTLQTSGGFAPVISAVADNSKLSAFWFTGSAFVTKSYDGAAWDANTTTIISSTVGARFPSCDLISGGGFIQCLHTSANVAPYVLTYSKVLIP